MDKVITTKIIINIIMIIKIYICIAHIKILYFNSIIVEQFILTVTRDSHFLLVIFLAGYNGTFAESYDSFCNDNMGNSVVLYKLKIII